MRPLTLLAIPFLVSTAYADRTGGNNNGGGGGALSHVSAGIGNATRSSQPTNPPPTGNTDVRYSEDYYDGRYCYDLAHRRIECPFAIAPGGYTPYYTRVGLTRHHRVSAGSTTTPDVDFYAGAQKVHDSDGSASIEVAVTDGRFRIAGAYSHYFERQTGGGVLTMAMPTLMGGIRIDDMGDTKVFVEGGVVHARTNGDQMGDSSITGPIAGVRVEHTLSKDLSLIGDTHKQWFDDNIRATDGRVGVRYKYVQASFRVLDFNVGPALYGPEVGVRF